MTDAEKIMQVANFQLSCGKCVHLNYISYALGIEKPIIRKVLRSNDFEETEEKGVFILKEESYADKGN